MRVVAASLSMPGGQVPGIMYSPAVDLFISFSLFLRGNPVSHDFEISNSNDYFLNWKKKRKQKKKNHVCAET
jgi:hypothetical protein